MRGRIEKNLIQRTSERVTMEREDSASVYFCNYTRHGIYKGGRVDSSKLTSVILSDCVGNHDTLKKLCCTSCQGRMLLNA
jgi:hypothetical protein